MTKKSTVIVLLLLALGVRAVGLGHSLPYRYVADTHVIRGALGMAQTKDLAPPPNVYTSYPYLLPYLLLPQFGALYVGGKVTGAWTDAQDFGRKMIDDPTALYWIARALITAFGVLAVGLTYRIARRALDERCAFVAAYLVATSLLLVHLGKDARPWVALAALVAFTAERTLAYVRAPSAKRAIWMGVGAGLCIACHQAGGLAVLLPASGVLARILAAKDEPSLWRRLSIPLRDGVISALLFGATALLIGFPYLLKSRSANVGVESKSFENERIDVGGQSFATEAFGLARFEETALGFIGFEPLMVICAGLGLLAVARRRYRFGSFPVIAIYPFAVIVLFLFYGGTHTRYLSTAVPLLAVIASVPLARALAGTGWKRVTAMLLLAFPLIQVARLDYVMSHTDTRTAFLPAIAEQVPEHSVVALESYGSPLRFDASAVERLMSFGQWASRAEGQEASLVTPISNDRPPYSVVPLERFYEFASLWPHQWLTPDPADPTKRVEKPIETFLDEVGAQYLVAADRRPGAARNSALDEVLARRGEKVAQIAPYSGSPPGEALLPMDPEFPLTAIWKVSRPGPHLTLWRIRPR